MSYPNLIVDSIYKKTSRQGAVEVVETEGVPTWKMISEGYDTRSFKDPVSSHLTHIKEEG